MCSLHSGRYLILVVVDIELRSFRITLDTADYCAGVCVNRMLSTRESVGGVHITSEVHRRDRVWAAFLVEWDAYWVHSKYRSKLCKQCVTKMHDL